MLSLASIVRAESAQDPWLTGSVRMAYWSGTRTLDDDRGTGSAALWLKGERQLDAVTFVAEGWARSDDLLRSESTLRARAREAYLQYAQGETRVRLGQQLIVWGRADQINPTDNLTPRDLTLLTPDAGDDRMGAWAVKLDRRIAGHVATVVWLPLFRPNITPFPGGLPITERGQPSAQQWAVKLDHSSGQGADWSVSYFSGRDLAPNLRLDPSGAIAAAHPRISVIGGDFAVPVGSFGLRGEAGYTRTEDDGPRPTRKRPFSFAVLGIERTFGGTFNVNAQWYRYQTHGFADPAAIADPVLRQIAFVQASQSHQLKRIDQGVTLRLADKWINETLEGEILLVRDASLGDRFVRARITYALDDHTRVTAGADVFRGPEFSAFGLLHKNSAGFVELRYSW